MRENAALTRDNGVVEAPKTPKSEGTSHMQNIPGTSRLKVSADGHGVVSHAGIGMVREVAEGSGLTSADGGVDRQLPRHPGS